MQDVKIGRLHQVSEEVIFGSRFMVHGSRLFQPCALNHESKKAIISIIAPQLAAMLAEVSTPSPHIHQAKVPLQFPLYHPPYQLECEPYKMQNEPSSVLGRENQVGPRIQEMTID